MPPSPSMNQEKVACTLDHGFTCALTTYEPAEVFDYHLFCMSHCKTVATEPQTQCVPLDSYNLIDRSDNSANIQFQNEWLVLGCIEADLSDSSLILPESLTR